MSLEKNKAIARRYQEEVWGKGDLALIDELVTAVAEGDKVVIRWKMQATHEHEFRGIAPAGKPVTVTGITILRIAGGKIVERWVNWDSMALRQPSEAVNLGAV